jgi:hypothetical protein
LLDFTSSRDGFLIAAGKVPFSVSKNLAAFEAELLPSISASWTLGDG